MKWLWMPVIASMIFSCSSSKLASVPADMVFFNGILLTMNDDYPVAEALAVQDGRIIAIGSTEDVMKEAGSDTQRIDLNGKTMLPGFVDSHSHAVMIGLQAMSANLLPPPDGEGRDIEALLTLLREWAGTDPVLLQQTGWIIGFGYDNSQLAGQHHPTRQDLDKVSETIPILIIHQSGHLGVANSKALALAGISASTPDPQGGIFQRESDGATPNGVAEEYGFFKILGAFSQKMGPQLTQQFVKQGTRLMASYGYTTAQEGRATAPTLNAIEQVANAEGLSIDLVVYPDILEVDTLQPSLAYQNGYRVGGAKLTIDGSPQGKTAWLTQAYFQVPENQPDDYSGYPAITEQQAMDAIEKAFANNWQILVHANGDAAIDLMIECVAAARRNHPDVRNRPVLVHGQTLRKDQVARLKSLAIFPSLFPMHTFYWGDYHRDSVLGPRRAEHISPTGWVRQAGMIFGTHHDAPVALPDSMRVLSATVSRRSRTGAVIGAEHRVSVDTALKAMTLWPAWQHFEENSKGSLEVGKLADLVVLSDNPMTVEESQLANIRILDTYKSGKQVYHRPLQ